MARKKKIPVPTQRRDPAPYDGPIERADGVRPYNNYLWPTEDWWAYHEFGYRGFSGRFHFGIIELNDGRFSVDGSVFHIENNSTNPFSFGERPGLKVVFDTREQAIRIAVARFIRLCRYSRKWTGFYSDGLTEENCQKAINWALSIAKRPPSKLRPLPKPPVKTGLALFDWENNS